MVQTDETAPSIASEFSATGARVAGRCGGRLRFISVIIDQTVARRILKSLGLPSEPPVMARARAPTLFDAPPPPDYDAA